MMFRHDIKNKTILPFNWRNELELEVAYSIDQDVILLDKPIITTTLEYPFKVDVTAAIICIKGKTEGVINLKPYTTDGACLITILPGQIMQYKSISEDFEGLFLVMSQKFTDSLMPAAADRLPLHLSVRDNPAIPLDDEALQGMISYFEMLKRVIRVEDHPYRIEVARHLTLAFFYGAGAVFHKIADNPKMTHHETLVEKFLKLVQTHFKEQRGLEFYANKLCVTAKHLSKIIKATSGKPANDWIDEHVALEAKALLKSTNMTVEQISEELNFPSQSFFGKYFKRVTGLSPRDYKVKG
jgi:AraC-like DNA-binding protein